MCHDTMLWIFIGHMSVSHWDLGKVVSVKLYEIGHALSITELDATPTSCMKQSFSVGYTVNLDTSFMLYTTRLHRAAQALDVSRAVRKRVLCHMRTTKVQISLRSLISAFVVRCLDSIISLDSIAKISRL